MKWFGVFIFLRPSVSVWSSLRVYQVQPFVKFNPENSKLTKLYKEKFEKLACLLLCRSYKKKENKNESTIFIIIPHEYSKPAAMVESEPNQEVFCFL